MQDSSAALVSVPAKQGQAALLAMAQAVQVQPQRVALGIELHILLHWGLNVALAIELRIMLHWGLSSGSCGSPCSPKTNAGSMYLLMTRGQVMAWV